MDNFNIPHGKKVVKRKNRNGHDEWVIRDDPKYGETEKEYKQTDIPSLIMTGFVISVFAMLIFAVVKSF